MITREEAWITATSSEDERETEWARTVVALYDDVARLKRTIACYDAAINEMPDRDLTAHISRRIVEYENDTPQNEKPRAPSRRWVPEEERATLALELRRLRAAEAPGTEDAAVAPWEDAGSDDRVVWRYWLAPGRAVIVSPHAGGWRWFGKDTGWSDPPLPVALDAMRAAVPGSV